jgi:hypothetical protein
VVFCAWLGLLLGSCDELPPDPERHCDEGSVCRDSDCDFICDLAEGIDARRDTDHDGMPDYLDTDSDNDGIRDREEAGDEDRLTPPVDRDKNGLDDYLDSEYPLHFTRDKRDASADATLPEPDAGLVATRDAGSEEPTGGPPYETQSQAQCAGPEIPESGCTQGEPNELACDGLDNDCDGRVDNDVQCGCTLGAARSCFLGPYGRRNLGACQSGVQRCVGEQFAHWGPCEGSKGPSEERCDGIDNDCDGCRDELNYCGSIVSCPGPGDPRVPDAKPFAPYVLDAKRFFAGPEAVSYRFTIRGSPCDRMFQRIDPSADAESGKQSYLMRYTSTTQAEVVFALSGSYTVDLAVITRDGTELHCSFDVHVRAPGLRVELCWDKTGPSAHRTGDAVDLDLHLAKRAETQQFEAQTDCYWQTCRGAAGLWGYANTTPLETCSGPSAQNFETYSALGFCPNPRLDGDNRLDARSRSVYITENINLDVPKPGDQFRVAVLYKANVLSDGHMEDAGTSANLGTRAWVNVYCEGDLLGTFGGAPEQQLDPNAIELSAPGMLWRVADVAVSNAGCEISPLRDPVTQRGYWVSSHDFSYGEP